MPMTMIQVGDRVRVKNLTGNDTVKKHLGELGMIPGALVTIVQISDGNMIVGIHDSRIAINEDLARRIMVEPM